jgi:hypothetical protein
MAKPERQLVPVTFPPAGEPERYLRCTCPAHQGRDLLTLPEYLGHVGVRA